ncbi:hypothetical protein F3Y22_tig00111582pilonHSYRG00736 [Hibiscus syriacus]|uniref:Reverse transcriptase zinc-binding domain-containing protein n=1 Tax=Hibiscus syriacus TaxID=106335 RepID=A0A6A2YDF2_HIBSY|nr:hypothetical protein F3Y22_tig00111582pilonHSYRG00736 [Hibiscus syriacus]
MLFGFLFCAKNTNGIKAAPLPFLVLNCFLFWRSIASIWPLFHSNLVWSVGKGDTIWFWNDLWVPNLGPLCNYATAFHAIEDDLKPQALSHIKNIHPPPINAGPDRIYWKEDSKRCFSVRSVFTTLDKMNWADTNIDWKLIWKLKCQRIRGFLWLAIQDKLLTNKVRSNRHFGSDRKCSTCNHTSETLLHILRDCPTTRQTWRPAAPSQWSPPDEGWVCLNTYGALSLSTGHGSAGGLLRDSSGDFLASFRRSLGHSSVLETELWGILEGLKIARNLGFERVIV